MADEKLVVEPISVTSPRLPDDGSLDDEGNPVAIPQAIPTAIVGGAEVNTGNPDVTYDDNISSEYLNQQAPLSPEAFRVRIEALEASEPEDDTPPLAAGEDDGVEGVGGYAADIGYGIANGVINAGTEINHTLANVADFLAPDVWQKDPEYFTKLANEYSPRVDGEMLGAVGLKVPASTAGNITKTVAQFMTGFVPALKAVRGIQGIASVGKIAMTAKTGVGIGAAGAVADLSVFNPYEKRLSNLAKDSGIPGFDNALTQYLAASDDDSELLGRLKQTAEGYVVGKVLEPFVALIGAYKKTKVVYAEEQGMVPPSQTTAAYMTDPATGAKVDVSLDSSIEKPRFTLKEAPLRVMDEQTEKDFANAYLDGNYEGAAEKASGFVNLKYLNTEEGIRDMIEGFALVKENALDKYTRGWSQAARNAGRLGADAIPEAAARVQGLDSFVIKAEETRTAVAYKVRELANIAKASPSEVTMSEFKDSFKKLAVIDAMVTGNKSEIARAMKAMQRPTTGGDIASSILAKSQSAIGMQGQSNWDLMAQMIGDMPDSSGVARMAKAASLPNWRDAVTEVYINALFSPPTFMVNAMANSLSIGGTVVERYWGATKSQIGGSGELTFREANNYALGLVKGITEGVSAFSQAWKTNAPVLGTENKFLETNHTTAFSGATFGIKDGDAPLMMKLGKGIDLAGTVLRSIPGGTRSLMASDEFFKGMLYRAEIAALAQREAQKIGLKAGTPEYLAKIREIELGASKSKVGEPYHGISMSSQKFAEVSTFTEALGEGGQKMLEGLRMIPGSYIVAPFVKTPINLIKYQTRRTPGLAGFSSHMITELTAGGARADLAEAQIGLGTMYLTAGLGLASGGYFKAQMTDNFAARRNITQLGVEQQAFVDKVTGQQLSIGRLDGNPLSFLMFSASVHETVQAYVEANGDEMSPEDLEDGILTIMAVPISVGAKLALSKSWAQGMSQALEAIQKDTEGNYIQKALGNTLPAGNSLKWVNKQSDLDPFLREASDWLEEIQSKIPGLSRSLPPVPDLLGNPTKTKQLDVFGTNPVTVTTPVDHPVMNELRRLQLQSPNEVILGGVTRQLEGVKLDGVEKWNFMQFVKNLKDPQGRDLADKLDAVIQSKDYQDPRNTDEARSNALSAIYNKHKDFAKKALQYDSLMFSKGLPRPYAEEYQLYDYKRITPLASKVGTKQYSQAQKLFGDIGKSRQEFIDERDEAFVKSQLGIELK
jgi:hypothetical protein